MVSPCPGGHVARTAIDRDGAKVWACRHCPAWAAFGTGQAWRYDDGGASR